LAIRLRRERVHRAELLAPALEALDARAQRLALVLLERLRRSLRARRLALESQAAKRLFALELDLRELVARTLRLHLRVRHQLRRRAQLRVDIRLLRCARAQLRRHPLARRALARQLRLELRRLRR